MVLNKTIRDKCLEQSLLVQNECLINVSYHRHYHHHYHHHHPTQEAWIWILLSRLLSFCIEYICEQRGSGREELQTKKVFSLRYVFVCKVIVNAKGDKLKVQPGKGLICLGDNFSNLFLWKISPAWFPRRKEVPCQISSWSTTYFSSPSIPTLESHNVL